MRELTPNEMGMVSGGNRQALTRAISSEEAMALATYYGAMGALTAGFGVTAGFSPVFFVLSAGFAMYSMV